MKVKGMEKEEERLLLFYKRQGHSQEFGDLEAFLLAVYRLFIGLAPFWPQVLLIMAPRSLAQGGALEGHRGNAPEPKATEGGEGL